MPNKPKRRRYKSLTLSEVSGVTKPAQEGALAEFAKANDAMVVDTAKAALTSAVDGHTHLVSDYDAAGPRSNGNTSWNGSGGFDTEHSHPWIRTDDGIVIGEAMGHTHSVAATSTMKAKEPEMTDKTQKDGEQVVETYKSAVTGQTYSAPGEIALAKQIDEQAQAQAVEKRVNDEFSTLASKGEDAGKALATFVLKSGDADAIKGLQAVETALAETTKQAVGNLGTAIGGVQDDSDEVFATKAAEWGKANGLIGSAAQVEFAKTAEGSALLAQSVAA